MTAPLAYNRSLHRYALAVAGATFVLVVAGGLVTSTGSGLSVPDWPLSFGTLFPRMEGGVRFEHTHRLIAAGVGLLTIALAVWIARREPRRWVRGLAFVAVGAVVIQGVLGGLTVLFKLPTPISVAHASLA
ncbi:MAG: COX15/CtaA family protein, partial [Gemmatimonadales bacterium]|nr:COX15/CtaA family protein [Gemmatimonadales bacterium]